MDRPFGPRPPNDKRHVAYEDIFGRPTVHPPRPQVYPYPNPPRPQDGPSPFADPPRLSIGLDHHQGRLGPEFGSPAHSSDEGSSELPWVRNDSTGSSPIVFHPFGTPTFFFPKPPVASPTQLVFTLLCSTLSHQYLALSRRFLLASFPHRLSRIFCRHTWRPSLISKIVGISTLLEIQNIYLSAWSPPSGSFPLNVNGSSPPFYSHLARTKALITSFISSLSRRGTQFPSPSSSLPSQNTHSLSCFTFSRR